MKTKTILLAVLLILGMGTVASEAKAITEPPVVKLLPISKNGMLRVLVNNPNHTSVRINFYKGDVILTRDKVYPKEYDKGFIKRYDLGLLKPGDYTISVVSSGITITYDVEVRRDKKVWARYWNNFLDKEQRVALN